MISNPDKKSRRTSAAFYGVLAFATIATTVFHESAHFGMGLALGHEMAMSFNQTHAVSAASVSERDAMLIAAAGPAVTISQAAIAFVLIRGRAQMMAYPFLFAAWFMEPAQANAQREEGLLEVRALSEEVRQLRAQLEARGKG